MRVRQPDRQISLRTVPSAERSTASVIHEAASSSFISFAFSMPVPTLKALCLGTFRSVEQWVEAKSRLSQDIVDELASMYIVKESPKQAEIEELCLVDAEKTQRLDLKGAKLTPKTLLWVCDWSLRDFC
jgi:hypothetical protein